jgi:hypothetical protein
MITLEISGATLKATAQAAMSMPRNRKGAISPTYVMVVVVQIPKPTPERSLPMQKTAFVVATNSQVMAAKMNAKAPMNEARLQFGQQRSL